MRIRRWKAVSFVLAASLACCASPIFALDGVVELSQSGAFVGAVTGDAVADPPGFPITITQPGSYALTSNLDVGVDASGAPIAGGENLTAIVIASPGVTVDLRGFRLRGPVTCSGQPAVCGASGNGDGIRCDAGGIGILDGTIRGFGNRGIDCEGDAAVRVDRLRVLSNAEHGIVLGDAGQVVESFSTSNGSRGIEATSGLSVARSIIFANGSHGLNVGSDINIQDSVISTNGGHGLRSQEGATVVGNASSGNALGGFNIINNGSRQGNCTVSLNSVTDNGDWGIAVGGGCAVHQNVVTGNGISVADRGGISSEGAGTIMENVISTNTGKGLRMFSGASGYGRNLIEGNTVDDLDQGTSSSLACNAVGGAQCGCPGAAACP